MNKEEFYERLKERDFEKLEKDLIEIINESGDLTNKYFLGICYSNQYEKKTKAIKIFKELLKENFKSEDIYLYLARSIDKIDESLKVIKEGLKKFPNYVPLVEEKIFFLNKEEKEEYYEYLKNEIKISFYVKLEMLDYFFLNNNYKKASEIIKDMNEIESYFSEDISFLKIIIDYMANNTIDTEAINSFLVVNDSNLRRLIVRLIEIISEENEEKIINFINILDYPEKMESGVIEIVYFYTGRAFYFFFEKIFEYLVKYIEEKIENEDIKRKIKLMYYCYIGAFDKEEKKEFKTLIELEIKKNKNRKLYLNLMKIYRDLGNNKKYFNAYVEANNISLIPLNIDLNEFNVEELIYITNTIKKHRNKFNKCKYQNLIKNLVIELHNFKENNEIVTLFDYIDYTVFDYIEFGFELAYAFKENRKNKEAKKIYEEYLKKYPNSSATINNLGVIYEQELNYEKAYEYYKNAEKIEHSDVSSNNIKRCEKKIKELIKESEIEQKAIDFFEKENVWIIERIKNFYEDADDKGNVICPYKNLPMLLKCNYEKAQDVLGQMLEKGYVFRNKNHNYDTSSSVYKINSFIKKRLEKMEKENQLITNFIGNFNDLTIQKLSDIEYEEIISKLKFIKNNKIKDMIIRDYNELIFNYLTNQQKSVVLLSGTIIELLLLFILDNKEIKKYKVGEKQKEKKVLEMDITEMLEVCDREMLVSNAPKKFIDGIKQFRNFIHPGKEIRERKLKLDRSTVELSFNIVNWLILNLEID